MTRSGTDTLTLALGAAMLLSFAGGADRDHRPPAGARTAIELAASKPGRKLAQAALGGLDGKINPLSKSNQGHLTARLGPL